MHNSPKKTGKKRRSRALLAFTMAMIMVFSCVSNVFAQAAWPGDFLVTEASFNGGSTIEANSSGQFDNITDAYQSVPVDSTLTLNFSRFKVFLFRGSWDPVTGTFSTVLNRDLVEIQDSKGNKVEDVTVSNANDVNNNTSGSDSTVNIHPNKPLNYDTNYKLVVKKYFSKSNNMNPPSIRGAVPADVVIPFKTEVQQKPTVAKAELRGSTLTLEGLPKNQKLQYNLAVDGNFNDINWKAFDYTDDSASIEISNVNLTANSKIEVGYAKDDNSAPDDVSDPITVVYSSSSAPSFSGAILNGTNLTLNGLPKNASSLEYQIAADGENYSDWKNLSVTGTTAVVDVSGLNLVGGQSIIQVRYKASPPWPPSSIAQSSFIYSLGMSCTLVQGKDTNITEGIKINSVNLNTPGNDEANNVTVRHSEGEKLAAPVGMTSMGFVEGDEDVVKSAGGVYGFSFKGAGNGDNNHVKITIPYQLPTTRPKDMPDYAVIDDSKVAIFMLAPFHLGNSTELWQYWQHLSTTIDLVNHTATVDITGFDTKGKDVILGVKYDALPPSNFLIENYSRTATSLSFNIFQGSSACGTKEMVVQRVNRADPTDTKTVTLSYKDYPKLLNFGQDNWIVYTDNDPKPGVNYDYTILSVTDMLGNKSCALDLLGKVTANPSPPCYATIDSMDTLVKETQDAIYANLKQLQNTPYYQPHIMFATGDSQNSVTQKISLPTGGILNYGRNSITWTSNRPDIVKIVNGDTEIHPPVDANGNPIKDGVTVTLTATINYATGSDGITHQVETATGKVTIPIIVKWNIANDEVILGNEFMHDPNMEYDYSLNTDPTVNINTAAKFDDSIIKTIVLQHSLVLKDKSVIDDISYTSAPQDYVIDGHGKTIKADFDGALFKSTQSNKGSFTLKNVVIDMNHKAGPILSSQYGGAKITFDNVKIINAENCQYGVMLQPGAGSFSANNCEFPSFKIAAINASTDLYKHTTTNQGVTLTSTSPHIPVDINNCTFDGEGKPGYGILDAFGKVSIKNSTFKGYKGNISTGWNSSNDSYEKDTKDGDGNSYYLYKGIPDGSPSAAILVKELGTANLSNNTISDCDNSILMWTGEKNFDFLSEKPESSFTAYCNVNEYVVNTSTASDVIEYLFNTNNIKSSEGSDTNRITVEDAGDLYNRKTILSKTSTGQNTLNIPVWPSDSKLTYSNVDETTITISWTPASDKTGISSYRIYNNGDLIGTVDGSVNTYKVDGLTPGVQQNFKVEAVNKDGKWSSGGPSAEVSSLSPAAPTWPAGSKVTVTEVGPTYVVLSWAAAQDKEKIRTYQVSSNYGYWTPGNVTSIKITDLKPNTSYTFNVKAEDESRLLSEPISVNVKTTDGNRSDWPQDSKLYASDVTEDGLTLYWDNIQVVRDLNPERNLPGQFYYRIYCDGKIIAEDVVDKFYNSNNNIPPALMYKVTGLSKNSEHTFKVESAFKLQNSQEEPVWSTDGPSLTVKTQNKTDKSVNIYFTDDNNSAKWKASIRDIKLYQYNAYPNPISGNNKLADEGKSLKGKYNISSDKESGKISIDGSVFDKAGDYIISIEADGYPPINVRQTINGDIIPLPGGTTTAPAPIGVSYQTHVQNIGWQDEVSDGTLSGTEGQGLRLEGIKLNLTGDLPAGAGIKYQTHVQNIGWQDTVSGGALSGTEGKGLRLEGIKISLENMPGYSIQYRVHVQNMGWQDWVSDGQAAGTEGKGLRLEAIEVKIVKVSDSTVGVSYKSQVQNLGWQSAVTNGDLSGTEGQGLRLEGVKLNLVNAPAGAGIKYQTHVQNIGWQSEVTDGDLSGTEGKGLRLEGIKISLENMPGYKVEYRAHVQNQGWQDWVSDGALAGTEGKGLRIEALEVRIVKVNN